VCCGLGVGGDGHAVAAGEGGEDVDGAELRLDGAGEGFEVVIDGAVSWNPECCRAVGGDGLDGGVDRRLVAADDRNCGAVVSERACGSGSDSTRPAGDDGDLSGEIRIAGRALRWGGACVGHGASRAPSDII
jgi:hypothetical protein